MLMLDGCMTAWGALWSCTALQYLNISYCGVDPSAFIAFILPLCQQSIRHLLMAGSHLPQQVWVPALQCNTVCTWLAHSDLARYLNICSIRLCLLDGRPELLQESTGA